MTREEFYQSGLPLLAALLGNNDWLSGHTVPDGLGGYRRPRFCLVGPSEEEVQRHAPQLMAAWEESDVILTVADGADLRELLVRHHRWAYDERFCSLRRFYLRTDGELQGCDWLTAIALDPGMQFRKDTLATLRLNCRDTLASADAGLIFAATQLPRGGWYSTILLATECTLSGDSSRALRMHLVERCLEKHSILEMQHAEAGISVAPEEVENDPDYENVLAYHRTHNLNRSDVVGSLPEFVWRFSFGDEADSSEALSLCGFRIQSNRAPVHLRAPVASRGH